MLNCQQRDRHGTDYRTP